MVSRGAQFEWAEVFLAGITEHRAGEKEVHMSGKRFLGF